MSRKSFRKERRRRQQQLDASRPSPNDMLRVKEFLIRQGEKSVAAEILNFFAENEGGRFRSRDIAAELGYDSDEDLPGFWHILHRLHEAGGLEKDDDRCYSLSANGVSMTDMIRTHQELAVPVDKKQTPIVLAPPKARFQVGNTYTGTLSTHPNGYGFVKVEGYEDEIYIPADQLVDVLTDDVIEVKVTLAPLDQRGKKESWSRRFEGELVRLVERKRTEIVGTLKRKNKAFQLIPDNSRIVPEIVVKLKDAKDAQEGDKVVATKLVFEKDHTLSAKVSEVLGRAGESSVEVAAIARSLGIDATFPKAVVAEANKLSEKISKDDLKGRLDYRDKVVFTIDPYDAKDFDDALSVEYLDNGDLKISVHIADVSHFVKEGTKLDEEAMRRSTSVYLVDRVIPMLPSNLSENICSLNPHVDRLAYSVIFTMNSRAQVLDYEIAKTVIHSKRRFTYEEVQDIIDAEHGDFYTEIHTLHALSKILMKERFQNGAIDFDTEEIKFKLDKDGKPIQVVKKLRLDSHRLIEEFMLLANRTVAKHVAEHFQTEALGYPSIYRVHDSPNPERIKLLSEFVRRVGFQLELKKNALNNDTASSSAMRKLLADVKGSPVEFLVSEIALRTMAKAIYSDKNIGHYGLGFEYYSHFTSPIRRYPDLIFHRLLFEYETLRKAEKKLAKPRLKKLRDLLPQICDHASEQERNATEAERDSIKLKQVEYISDHLGNDYNGIISGVTEFGIYVKLAETGIEGLVHIKNMQDDYYEFDERTYSLVGKRRHKRYQLGKDVRVKVHAVDAKRRTIDFLLVS